MSKGPLPEIAPCRPKGLSALWTEALADLGVEAKMPSLEAVAGQCRAALALFPAFCFGKEMTDGKSKKKATHGWCRVARSSCSGKH